MYTDKKSILQLASLLRSFGIKRIVLCPGSRNIPIVQTFANIPDFTCYPMTDERSAGFFALGLALHGGTPVAVCCTSGTALLNLHPAVAEAFYQQVPLVIISADRPAAWIGQMDGQTLPQPGVFGTLVKKSVNLPEQTKKVNGSATDLSMKLCWNSTITVRGQYISTFRSVSRSFYFLKKSYLVHE